MSFHLNIGAYLRDDSSRDVGQIYAVVLRSIFFSSIVFSLMGMLLPYHDPLLHYPSSWHKQAPFAA